MKRSLMLMALWAAGNVAAAQLTVAVTLAMDAGTLSDLAAAVARMNDAVPSRLVVRGIPLRAGWEKDAYWKAPAEKQRVLKAELTAAWADFARQLPTAGVEIASRTPRSLCWRGTKRTKDAKGIARPSSSAGTSPQGTPSGK